MLSAAVLCHGAGCPTLRSSGPQPARHLGREPASVIIGLAAQAPRRLRPLSSNVRQHRAALSMPSAVPVQVGSSLGAYAARGAFTDCYALSLPFTVSLPQFVEAFYTSRLFKLERWLLAKALNLPSSDLQARELAEGLISTFSAWKVEHRSRSEILLNAGQTRSWLSVAEREHPESGTTLLFGSAVVPARPGGEFGIAFHVLLGFHRVYSKLLLSAAARNLGTVRSRGVA